MTSPDRWEEVRVQIEHLSTRPNSILRALDQVASRFIDDNAYPDPDDKLRAKVFVISHFLSPNLALAIAAMLYFGAGVASSSLYWLVLGFALFFVYPFIVKRKFLTASPASLLWCNFRCSSIPHSIISTASNRSSFLGSLQFRWRACCRRARGDLNLPPCDDRPLDHALYSHIGP